MKKTLLRVFLALPILAGAFAFNACEEEHVDTAFDILNTLNAVLQETDDESVLWGWNEDSENLAEVESGISFSSASSSGSLPTSVNIEDDLPPIGNQGPYGTCVAWAVGYNMRTYMNSYYTDDNPGSAGNQSSPKDLFLAIDAADKGDDCGGTYFEAALDVLVERGVADLETVPYDEMNNCEGTPQSAWDDVAQNYKIANYRKIGAEGDIDISSIKEYLANNRIVVIGARLGDNFMDWSSSNEGEVLSSETYDYAGQHAYHAMVIGGYDDNKDAFKVINSWATSWGVDGTIWIDYDFFASEFCFGAFVGNSLKDDPDPDDDNEADNTSEGNDLIAWELTDQPDENYESDTARVAKYNVFNSGENTIQASQEWNILVVYYNAYDAEDYGIILYDKYTDDYGNPENYWARENDNGELGNNGFFSDADATAEDHGQMASWWNNVDVEPGESVAAAVYNDPEERFRWPYDMPAITGDYYLVTIADGFDVIDEADEENNYYYLTDENGEPLTYENGVLQSNLARRKNAGKPGKYQEGPSETAVTKSNLNTYTPDEITKMIKHHRNTGELKQKVMKYLNKKGKSMTK